MDGNVRLLTNEMTDEAPFTMFDGGREGGLEELRTENVHLKTLLDSLRNSIVEAKDNLCINSCDINPDTPLYEQHRQIQEIFDMFKKMKRAIKRFEDENKYMESLMSCLHDHISTSTEANHVSFEPPSEFPSDSAVARSNKAAQAIWCIFMQMNRSKEKNEKKNKKLPKPVDDMDRSSSRGNETVIKLRNREHSLLSEIDSIDAVNRQLQDDSQTLQSRIDVLTDELEQLKVNFQIQKDLNTAIDEKWKSEIELLKKANNRIRKLEIQLNNHQQGDTRFKEAYDAEVTKTENQQKQIDGLQLKCDELLHRLSKLAGDRLIHENTNIADLSNADRPSKLAEAYSELYDNEWTDAFEELISRGLPDKEVVGKLLHMLLMSFHKCREITWERYCSLQSIMSTIDINAFACVRGFPEHHACSTTMSFEQEKEIKRIWRTTTTALRDEAVKQLHSVLLTKCDLSIDASPKTSNYLAICIDLCWEMGVQERPMHLDADVEMDDSSEKMIDLNKFRPYTKSGKIVDFVVWPALFMHEGGPVLVRGIAQACNKVD